MAQTVEPGVRDEAAERFGVDPGTLVELVRDGAPDGLVLSGSRDGGDVFLKIKQVSPDDLGVEHARVALQQHVGGRVRVPTYLPSRQGRVVEVLDGGHVATLTARVPGRHLRIPEDFTPAVVREWAGTVGRLHAAARDWPQADALPDWRSEHAGFLAGCRDNELRDVWLELGTAMAQLPTDPGGYGAVHNDPHTGNLLLVPDGTLALIDFDVAARHWYLTDLAIAIAHPVWELRRADPASVRPFVTTVLGSYRAQNPLAASWDEHLPLLVRYRMALLTLAMQAEVDGGPLPGWVSDMRRWVLSGEPMADLGV